MSYAQRKQLSGNRGLSIFLTVAVVGSLLYAIVTGLAYDVIKKTAENLKVIDVEQQPPPPPKDMPKVPPPPVTPPPLVQVAPVTPPPIQTVTAPPVPPVIPPVIAAPPPPPSPPPAPHKVQSAQAKGSLVGLFNGDTDYPESARDAGAEGTAVAEMTIGPDGRVTGCTITRSTGNSALDAQTCNIIRRRARFTPAKDSNGNPTSDTQESPPITWRLAG
jgi:protein TonB